MGQLTFSKLQFKQYKEIKDKFSESNGMIFLSDEDNVRLREVLILLEHMGYIRNLRINNTNAYDKLVDFDSFEEWHNDQQREERKLSAREWKIGRETTARPLLCCAIWCDPVKAGWVFWPCSCVGI